jgi:hypothetical protein
MHIAAPHETFDSRSVPPVADVHSASPPLAPPAPAYGGHAPEIAHLAGIHAPHQHFSSRNLNVATGSDASTPLTPRGPPMPAGHSRLAAFHDSFLPPDFEKEDLTALRLLAEEATGSSPRQSNDNNAWLDPDEVLAEIDVPNQEEAELIQLLKEKGQRMLEERFPSEDLSSEVRLCTLLECLLSCLCFVCC